ncbi:GGDEF domain-containing protein [Jiella pelagia]|uniref:diguanylate cyclase n=1 Tax=Jiella pelagia TaxID=2986949 RepID=A0ABY7BZF5_9HYPH|nr:GGDEF domain-containing protein [Jiella pelagia]WAP68164.1 GGDEF domain-containing protein [Jiella pelagia]
MGESISIYSAAFALTLGLAVLCALIYVALRSHGQLLWLSAALLCAGFEIIVLSPGVDPVVQTIGESILMPFTYLCASQAVRLLSGRSPSSGAFVALIAALVAISLVLSGMGMSGVYQTLPFKAAAALALADILFCLGRVERKDVIDVALFFAVCGLGMIFLLRLPIYPSMSDGVPSPYGLDRSEIASVLLTISAFLAPATVLLVVAKIVANVLTEYRTKSERDSLTDLLNRRAFEQVAEDTRRAGGAVVLCDLDNFKRINDSYGHLVGDDVICAFASLLRETNGSAARLGGEEFALPLPGASLLEAVAVGESIRRKFEAIGHLKIDPGHRLTASFGVAAFSPDRSADQTIAAADQALYRAKRSGRNRVEIDAEAATSGRAWRAA